MSDLPDPFDLRSQDPLADRIAGLRDLIPEAFREDKVDVDALRRSLGDWVDPGPERFGLTWPGKAECLRVIQEPSIGTLVPMREESVDFDNTQNVIIEGENLEVLKLLQKAYYGKVKLIYIDPPYNTGNEFIYPDNFKEGLADYLKYSGQVDDEGFRLSSNAETDGRYHSKWLSMMYPRLFLARNLLREDGVIFVSIDDHEVHNLRAIMNEIFGEENFVTQIEWQKRYTRSNNTDDFSSVVDHLCVYQKGEKFTVNLLAREATADARFSNPDKDPRGPWKGKSFLNQLSPSRRPRLCYPITNPKTGEMTKNSSKAWRVSPSAFNKLMEDGRLYWGSDGQRPVPEIKTFLSEVRQGMTPINLWSHQFAGHTDAANAELKELFGEKVFDTPKPSKLIRRILEHGSDDDSLILDFFAGSGATGQAVIEKNSEDGGQRRFILVQLPEQTGAQDYPTISAITRDRIRRLAENIRERPAELGAADLDVGFRAYSLGPSNFKVWSGEVGDPAELASQLRFSVDRMAAGGKDETQLTEILLKAGYPLTVAVQKVQIAERNVYSVEDGSLLVCLSPSPTLELFEEMARREPAMILISDAGFRGNDELKVNALQTVRARNHAAGGSTSLLIV